MAKRLNFEKIQLSEMAATLVPDPLQPTTVLVVDDERLVADTLVAILNKQHYLATAAYSAEQALGIVQALMPDVLITDIMMPGMNGIDLATAVKEQHSSCKILLFSGHAHVAKIYDDPRCVHYDFPLLTKPVHPDALLAYIANLPSVATTAPLASQFA